MFLNSSKTFILHLKLFWIKFIILWSGKEWQTKRVPPRKIFSIPLLLPPSYRPKYFPQHPVLEHPQTMYYKGLLCKWRVRSILSGEKFWNGTAAPFVFVSWTNVNCYKKNLDTTKKYATGSSSLSDYTLKQWFPKCAQQISGTPRQVPRGSVDTFL